MSKVTVPTRVPVPEVSATVTFLLAASPTVELLPKLSWVLITGWVPKADPAVAPPGWVLKTRVVAAAGATVTIGWIAMVVRVPPLFLVLVGVKVLSPATVGAVALL